MSRRLPIFYSALLLTGVNLLLRVAGTGFQVYLSGRIGAAGIGLLQLVMSVGGLALVAGMAGIRTGAMYLTAEELGHKRSGQVVWILSGCFLYSICFSGTIAVLLYGFAPQIAELWIGDIHTVSALRLFAAFLPATCLCGVMCGYFTAANRIGTLAAVEVAEQVCTMVCTVMLLTLWAGHDAGRSCQAVVMGSGMGIPSATLYAHELFTFFDVEAIVRVHRDSTRITRVTGVWRCAMHTRGSKNRIGWNSAEDTSAVTAEDTTNWDISRCSTSKTPRRWPS